MAKRARPKGRDVDDNARRSDRLPGAAPTGQAPAAVASFPAPPGPSAEAVAVFEQAMEALQRHEYQAAAGRFKVLLSEHPSEGVLLDRARVYLGLAERELGRRPVEPRTLEERLTAATAALNNGDHDAAESLARGVLAEDPHQDLALYLLASVEARRGLFDAALSYLGQAIAISPEARAQARFDPDFEPLYDNDAFRELTETPLGSGPNLLRRAKRGRPER